MAELSAYQPIACNLHSEYEIAIMRRQFMLICWIDENAKQHNEMLQPYDVLTAQGEEFLLAKTKNKSERKIRLDRIQETK